jgi:3-hydroxybutyryl-CoA dehydratase
MIYERDYTITTTMVKHFGEATGDHNPLHFDEEFASKTKFGGKIVHGMLTAGLISASMTECYGVGTIYLEQDLKFMAPVREGDTVKVEFYNESSDGKKTKLFVIASVEGKHVVEGWALIIKGDPYIVVDTTH